MFYRNSESQRHDEAERHDHKSIPNTHQHPTLPYHYLATINELSGVALESGFSRLVEEVPSATIRTLDLQYSEVMEVIPGEGKLLLRSAVGWPQHVIGRLILDPEPGSGIEEALRTGDTTLTEDRDRRQPGRSIPSYSGIICSGSGINAVIRSGGQSLGVLGVHSSRPKTFSPIEVYFIETVAQLLGRVAGKASSRELVTEALPAPGHEPVTEIPNGRAPVEQALTERTRKVLAVPPAARELHITPRQYEALLYMSLGKSDQEMASLMNNIGLPSVRTHIQRLREAFGVKSKDLILHRARDLGILNDTS